MIVFFAATPYQLLACIQIKTNCFTSQKADLVLLSFNVDMSLYQTKIEASKIFEQVIITVEPYQDIGSKASSIQRMCAFLTPKKYEVVKRLVTRNYNIMFSSCIGLGNNFYFSVLRKVTPQIKFMYYDEGVGNYCVDITKWKQGRADRLREMLGYRNPYKKIDQYWVYQPNWVVFQNTFNLKKIPAIDSKNISFEIFSKESERIPSRYIYLDAPHRETLNISLDYSKLIDAFYEADIITQMCIKRHPIQKKSNFEICGMNEFPQSDIPWEVLINEAQIEEKILLSICSTAVITPKMLYNREPIVILLYKLFEKEWDLEDTYKLFFNNVSKCYKQNRFFVPNTWNEFSEILKFLQKQSGK